MSSVETVVVVVVVVVVGVVGVGALIYICIRGFKMLPGRTFITWAFTDLALGLQYPEGLKPLN